MVKRSKSNLIQHKPSMPTLKIKTAEERRSFIRNVDLWRIFDDYIAYFTTDNKV